MSSPAPTDLTLDDINNFRKVIPHHPHDGKINWVVTGGGAAFLLTQADEVIGRTLLCEPTDERRHKDLDVFVFRPEHSTLELYFPHEVLRSAYFSKPRRHQYHRMSADFTGFHFDVFTGYHLGFPPPTLEDVVEVRIDGTKWYCVSPEYLIATRMFDSRPVRKDEDQFDIHVLHERFLIITDDVVRIVRKSNFKWLTKREICKCVLYRDSVLANKFAHDEAKRRHGDILTTVQSKFESAVFYESLKPTLERGLLRFRKNALNCEVFKAMQDVVYNTARHEPEKMDSLGWSRRSATGEGMLLSALLLYPLAGSRIPDILLQILGENKWSSVSDNDHTLLKLTLELLCYLLNLKAQLRKHKLMKHYRKIAQDTILRFILSDYRTILIGAVWQAAQKMRETSDPTVAHQALVCFARHALRWRNAEEKL